MSFGSPLALAAVAAVLLPLAGVLVLQRRRPGTPVAFTNLGVLESVAHEMRRPTRP